jgi:hypothetical protein
MQLISVLIGMTEFYLGIQDSEVEIFNTNMD